MWRVGLLLGVKLFTEVMVRGVNSMKKCQEISEFSVCRGGVGRSVRYRNG